MTGDARSSYLLVLSWDLTATGGVNQVVLGLYDALRADGRLVPHVLVTASETGTARAERDAAGRSLIRARVRAITSDRPTLREAIAFVLTLPAQLWRLRALVKKYRVAVVNCHYVGGSDLTWAIAKRLGIFRGKLMLSVHGLDVRTVVRITGVRRLLWRWTLRQVDAIVACSQALAAETAQGFGLPPSRVMTIHNGVDAAAIAAVAAAGKGDAARSNGGPRVLNLATFEHKKGHDVLLAAFKLVLERRPDAHLTIMGRRADTADATCRRVTDLGLTDRVSLHMDAPHAAALRALGAADLFVLSSRNEGFAVVLLEAGALSRPIVATNVCGVTELIQDGVTGIIVPAEDPHALAEGMLRALQDREGAAARSRRLQEVVTTRFTTAATCRGYLQLAGYA